jgi:23S rRNA (cytidine1920-2'-O)/16S rRNA (cytidine1409-2'-O)-methyltransferase
MSSNAKIRLTELLVARGLADDIREAERFVYAGDVLGADAVLTQPNMLVTSALELRLKSHGRHVSRGGDKLAGALDAFAFDPAGLRCLDVGASTGGFTDCLLRRAAASVAAVDVAYGQLAWSLRCDERVSVFERSNIRELAPATLGAPFDLVVADVSFTPLRSLLALLFSLLDDRGTLIALIKPQFELPAAQVGTGGIVTDPASHVQALELVVSAVSAAGGVTRDLACSTPRGARGNREFFLLAQRTGIPVTIDIHDMVARAHAQMD